MDGLSAASSVIAVIQISNQIFDLCRTYYLNVKDARKDIQRLRNEITALQDMLVSVADLADDPKSSSLKTLKLISKEDGPVKQCELELKALAAKLDPGEEKGRMRQFGLRALKWPFSAKDVDKMLAAIGRHKLTFALALTTDQTSLSLTIAQGVSDITQKLDSQKLEDDREIIIQWLSTTDPSTNLHAASKKCQQGSGRWLLERAEFRQWQSTGNSFLWLHGIPGSGKTILRAVIVQELQDQCRIRPNNALAYFYFDFNTTAKQNLSHCLSSIVAQLCSHKKAFLNYSRKCYERCSYGKHQPTIDEMRDMLFDVIIDLDNVFIILDALDECPKNEERARLLTTVSDIMLHSSGNLHVLVTSRRELDIEEALLPLLTCPAISVQGPELNQDIKIYISWQLATDAKLKKWPKSIKAEIESCLMTRANGMFRWVDCQLDVLKRCLKVSLIREALKNLPKTLDDTYSRVFVNIDEVYREDARNALMWLAFAERPLQLQELAEATIIHPSFEQSFIPEERFPDPQNVLEILSSLVTVDYWQLGSSAETWEEVSIPESSKSLERLMTISLAHYSVKEYLISERIKQTSACYLSMTNSVSHNHIAKCTLQYILHYLSSPSKSDSATDLQTFPLLAYAARYWPTHIHLMFDQDQKLLTLLVLKLLLTDVRSWLHIYRPPVNQLEALDKANNQADTTLSALFYASDMGLHHVVQELLFRGTDPNGAAEGAEDDGESPLHRAAIQGHEDVMLLLLGAGAKVNVRDMSDSTPLHYAVKEAQCANHISIVRHLLGFGADINASNNTGRRPLHLAAEHGFLDIVTLLLENGAVVDARNHLDQTALHWAAVSEHEEVTDLLLTKGADINAQNTFGETALHYAAISNTRMLPYLLRKGASPNTKTNCGETPIQWAAKFYEKDSMECLVKAGASR